MTNSILPSWYRSIYKGHKQDFVHGFRQGRRALNDGRAEDVHIRSLECDEYIAGYTVAYNEPELSEDSAWNQFIDHVRREYPDESEWTNYGVNDAEQ